MKRRILLLLAFLTCFAGVGLRPAGAAESKRLDEPVFHGHEIKRAFFGDATNVELLAGLLNDPDQSVREQAIRGLGETHNTLALPHIRGALKDAASNVRAAAVTAAVEFPADASADIVIAGLADADSAVVIRALRTVRRMELTTAAQPVAKLLARESSITPVVLDTLTHLKRPAAAEKLKELINSDSVRVRLAAAGNILLLDPAGAAGLVDDLEAIAKSDRPAAVRASAIVALAKFAFDRARGLVAAAGTDPDPLVRRSALLAWRNAGRKDAIRAFLDDKSPMVRIAAIRAAGELKCEDCADRLFRILMSAPIDTRRTAPARANSVDLTARDALRRIGTKRGVALAARGLRMSAGRLEISQKFPQITRNARTCCWILGELKSTAAFDVQLSMLGSLKLDSPVLPTVVEALGKIGDRRAVEPLIEKTKYSVKKGKIWLRTRLQMPPPDVEYSEETAAALVVALARLKAFEAVGPIHKTALGGTLAGGIDMLEKSRSAAVQALGSLVNATNREEIEKTLAYVLASEHHGDLARFRAAVSAGKLKSEVSLDALKQLLNRHRPEKRVMHAAAWAIQEITGTTPTIPNPITRQNGQWIVKKAPPPKKN